MPHRKEYSRHFTHDNIRLVDAFDAFQAGVRITGQRARDHIAVVHPERDN
jgi:hypothetical protein